MNLAKTFLIAFLLFWNTFSYAQWTQVQWAEDYGTSHKDFVNDNVGYAYMHMLQGFVSTLRKTTDGGQTWTDITLPVQGADFLDLDFYSETEGVVLYRAWATGTTETFLYRTMDSGQTWENITPDNAAVGYGLSQVQFLDANTGFFVIEETLYSTQDAGQTWSSTDFGVALVSVHFKDANSGIIGTWDGTFLYSGGMLTTNDGGQTWNSFFLETAQSVIGKVIRIDENVAYAAPVKWGSSNQFFYYKTIDNGVNWTEQAIPTTIDNATIADLDFKNSEIAIMVLESQNTTYTYITADSGQNWLQQNEFNRLDIPDLQFTPTSGYITELGGEIYRFMDVTLNVEVANSTQLTLYPNPVENQQIIRWNSDVAFTEIRLIDVTGKQVFGQSIIQNEVVLPSLQAGIYFAIIQNKDVSSVVKILVK